MPRNVPACLRTARSPRGRAHRQSTASVSFGPSLLQLLGDPARLGLAEERPPGRHRGAWTPVQDHRLEQHHVALGERLGQERRTEPALQRQAVAGAAVLAHQLDQRRAARALRLGGLRTERQTEPHGGDETAAEHVRQDAAAARKRT